MSASLLDRDATGGVVARKGFEYQDAFVLQHLPEWISQGAFSHFVSESKGDFEACYFCPSFGIRRKAYEAKDYALAESAFWKEINDFKEMYDAAPNDFVRFVLVCQSFKSHAQPLISALERLRGVGASYPVNSPIVACTRDDITARIVSQGQSKEMAEFVIERVDFLQYSAASADASFPGMLEKHLPQFDFSSKRAARLRDSCKALIARSTFGPIHRLDIEKAIAEVLDADAPQWLNLPTEVKMLAQSDGIEDLVLEVGAFLSAERAQRTCDEWETLNQAAVRLAHFISTSRERRSVALDGKQRMSLSCLLGHAFGATKGFSLTIRHNGLLYRTDDHSKSEEDFFAVSERMTGSEASAGVVCIGFPTPVGSDSKTVPETDFSNLPALDLTSFDAISTIAVLNKAVAEAKLNLIQFRSAYGLQQIHLFLKSPSFFAMSLGHRLNGISNMVLYDWIDGRYVKTVELR